MFIYSKIDTLIAKKQSVIKGITIRKMCTEMDIKLTTFNKTKSGKAIPGVDIVEKIANYFEVDINYFFESYSSVVSSPLPEYGHSPDYKALFEMQKEINEIIKENADLKIENERLKNVNAPEKSASAEIGRAHV